MAERVKELQDAGDAFHAHLDECKQCEQRPFDLCSIGHVLINRAAGVELPKTTAEDAG
jgi:hypothetical protein